MSAIKLNDILHLEDLDKVKIRLNLSNNKWNALKLYHENRELLLIGHFHNSENRKWFKENDIVIGLAEIAKNEWLLIDISRITKSYDKFWDKIPAQINTFYEHEQIEKYKKYFGRLIIKFHKDNAYVTLKGEHIDRFYVKELLPDIFDNDMFPGYDRVNISWEELSRVVEKGTWKTALQNQKGVYLITDISNGKRYVGSAYGKEMLLGRWNDYVKIGHGNNKELKNLSFDYIKQNFRYSILDIFKSTTNDDIIIERESWWKEVLLSRDEKYGYNKN